MRFDVLAVSLARALVEVAGFALLGQGALALLVGEQRRRNGFYRILAIITAPVLQALRRIMPRWVGDAFLPVLAFLLLFCLWILLALAKRQLCAPHGC